jgi:hypothetical protein
MTGKERILAALAGDKADRVPFVPHIWQWFYVNEYNGTLPPEAQGATHPVDVLRRLGADIFSKFEGSARTEKLNDCSLAVSFEGKVHTLKPLWSSFATFEGGNIRREKLATPHGVLTHTWEYAEDGGAPFESEHWWKDFDAEYAAVRDWITDASWRLDPDALQSGLQRVGDDGTILFQLLPTPLKQFHWLAGQVNATLFLVDHPTEMQELARIWERKSLEFLEEVADLPNVWVYEMPDNLDSMFYPPYHFRALCLPVLQKAAQLLHARGKYLFIHACGHLKALAPLVREANLDCVEGQAPPPIGDWPLAEARVLSDQLIICGGMAAPEQEYAGPDAATHLDAYVRTLFTSLGDKRRFLFGSSCNTSPRTPYGNMVAFRDAAWRYGQF